MKFTKSIISLFFLCACLYTTAQSGFGTNPNPRPAAGPGQQTQQMQLQGTQSLDEKQRLNPTTPASPNQSSKTNTPASANTRNPEKQPQQRSADDIAARKAAREKGDTSGRPQQKIDEEGFEKFKRNFINSLWKTYPGWATSVGFHKLDSVLVVPNAEARQNELTFADKIDKKLHSFPYDTLSSSNKADYKIIENFIAGIRFSLKELNSYQWDPSSYNVGGNFMDVMDNKQATLEDRLRAISYKLKNVPAYYDAAKKNISKPTKEHTQLAINQNKGALSVFTSALPDSLSKSKLSESEKATITKDILSAKQAIDNYVAWLQKDILPNANRDFRIGKDLYEKKFALDINSQYTASQVFAKAQSRQKELQEKMSGIADSLWATYMGNTTKPTDNLKKVKLLIDTLSIKHCKKEEFLSTIEAQLPELTNFINQKQLIKLDPSKPLRVRKTPGYMDGVAGASLSSPGPYDKAGTTWYNVSPLTGYSEAEAESYLREYNDWVLQILNIHEAIPGHYVQAVYANKSPDLLKTILGNGATIEGWACYAERMMIEEGYHSSPEMRLFYYKWNLREVSNFILDYNVHNNKWTEKQALDLLVNEAFQQTTEAKEKYERATLTQVQLGSYFTGLTEIYDLREEIKALDGKEFKLGRFHSELLSYGSAPVKVIRELMLEERAKQKGSSPGGRK